MTIIEQIKAEIERLYEKYETKYHETRLPYVEGLLDGFDLVEQFLDTLESEKPRNQEELEEEIWEYMSNEDNNPFDWDWRDKRDCARHFAEWGAERQKEQMLKEAVEGVVHHYENVHWLVTDQGELAARLKQFRRDEKVRLVIVKE